MRWDRSDLRQVCHSRRRRSSRPRDFFISLLWFRSIWQKAAGQIQSTLNLFGWGIIHPMWCVHALKKKKRKKKFTPSRHSIILWLVCSAGQLPAGWPWPLHFARCGVCVCVCVLTTAHCSFGLAIGLYLSLQRGYFNLFLMCKSNLTDSAFWPATPDGTFPMSTGFISHIYLKSPEKAVK